MESKDGMGLADDIEKFRLEHPKFHVEIEKALRETYFKDYFKEIDEQLVETEELRDGIKDLVFRRYERTLIHYIPWVSGVFDLSDKEIVEIGCGTGCSTAAFAHFAKHIYAYEVSESSTLTAQARMQIMGINNVSIVQSDPESLLKTLKSNHCLGVSAILLFAVLEHMTIQERLETLKGAWDLLLPDGILIIAETPNRLTYFDYHTSWLPFFHFLPLELAVKYYEKSPRYLFKLAVENQLKSGVSGDARDTLIRWGNAVSFHEFEMVLGSNLEDLLVADGNAEEMRSLYPLSTEEKLLQQYFIEKNVHQPLAFTNQILNLIFQKKDPQSAFVKTSLSTDSRSNGFEVVFKEGIIKEIPSSAKRVALLVTPEYEGIFRNGGIGTYYRTLSERLAEDFYVILLLCQSQGSYDGESTIPALKHIFSTKKCEKVLELQPTHLAMLSQLQEWKWIDRENYCALFFAQAIAAAFPDAYLYIEFPEMLGLGYRTVQAKRSGMLGDNCVVAVTLHSGQEWLQEAQARYTQPHPQWHWQTSQYEQYSFEQADLAFFLSHFLKEKVEQYGWKTNHALHLPYCFSVIEQSAEDIEARRDLQQLVEDDAIPLIFFGRLEERKGLLTFLEAVQLLKSSMIERIHVLFLGKSVEFQTDGLKGLESEQYIRQILGENCRYSIVTDLFSQEAIQWVSQLHSPIVCLTSFQENFPNTALEMGQLPIRLVVSDTGGFRETLDLIERTKGVHWFRPGEARSLAQVISEAVAVNSETIAPPQKEALQYINQRLLLQRFEYMWRASMRMAAPAGLEPEEGKARQWILGMTSEEEQVYLETYAENEYSGQGEIVELGCWLGSSTISLAMGLKKNLQVVSKAARIHAYDIFIWYSSHNMERTVLGTSVAGKYKDGDSFLDEYLRRIHPWSDLIKVYPGDLTQIGWERRPIEFLFVDAMKSWELANGILRDFFPSLIPGLSLVVHQDFAHFYQVWIHLTMYRLREYFTPLENHPFLWSSVVFRYVKAIPEEMLNISYSLASFSEEEAEAAFEYSMSVTPKQTQPNIAAAKVMYLIQAGRAERAKLELSKARANFDSENWWNLIDVEEWLDRGDWFKQYRD